MPAGTQDGGSEDQLKRGYLRGGPRRTGCGLLRRGGRAAARAAVAPRGRPRSRVEGRGVVV